MSDDESLASPEVADVPSGTKDDRDVPSASPAASVADREEILCRFCRGGDDEEALLHPCKCSGSIRFIHEKCLRKWLHRQGHSSTALAFSGTLRSAKCELCGYNFRFESVYSPGAPEVLSLSDVLEGLWTVGGALCERLHRATIALCAWFLALPYVTYSAVRLFFCGYTQGWLPPSTLGAVVGGLTLNIGGLFLLYVEGHIEELLRSLSTAIEPDQPPPFAAAPATSTATPVPAQPAEEASQIVPPGDAEPIDQGSPNFEGENGNTSEPEAEQHCVSHCHADLLFGNAADATPVKRHRQYQARTPSIPSPDTPPDIAQESGSPPCSPDAAEESDSDFDSATPPPSQAANPLHPDPDLTPHPLLPPPPPPPATGETVGDEDDVWGLLGFSGLSRKCFVCMLMLLYSNLTASVLFIALPYHVGRRSTAAILHRGTSIAVQNNEHLRTIATLPTHMKMAHNVSLVLHTDLVNPMSGALPPQRGGERFLWDIFVDETISHVSLEGGENVLKEETHSVGSTPERKGDRSAVEDGACEHIESRQVAQHCFAATMDEVWRYHPALRYCGVFSLTDGVMKPSEAFETLSQCKAYPREVSSLTSCKALDSLDWLLTCPLPPDRLVAWDFGLPPEVTDASGRHHAGGEILGRADDSIPTPLNMTDTDEGEGNHGGEPTRKRQTSRTAITTPVTHGIVHDTEQFLLRRCRDFFASVIPFATSSSSFRRGGYEKTQLSGKSESANASLREMRLRDFIFAIHLPRSLAALMSHHPLTTSRHHSAAAICPYPHRPSQTQLLLRPSCEGFFIDQCPLVHQEASEDEVSATLTSGTFRGIAQIFDLAIGFKISQPSHEIHATGDVPKEFGVALALPDAGNDIKSDLFFFLFGVLLCALAAIAAILLMSTALAIIIGGLACLGMVPPRVLRIAVLLKEAHEGAVENAMLCWSVLRGAVFNVTMSALVPLAFGGLIGCSTCDVAFAIPQEVRASLSRQYVFFSSLINICLGYTYLTLATFVETTLLAVLSERAVRTIYANHPSLSACFVHFQLFSASSSPTANAIAQTVEHLHTAAPTTPANASPAADRLSIHLGETSGDDWEATDGTMEISEPAMSIDSPHLTAASPDSDPPPATSPPRIPPIGVAHNPALRLPMTARRFARIFFILFLLHSIAIFVCFRGPPALIRSVTADSILPLHILRFKQHISTPTTSPSHPHILQGSQRSITIDDKGFSWIEQHFSFSLQFFAIHIILPAMLHNLKVSNHLFVWTKYLLVLALTATGFGSHVKQREAVDCFPAGEPARSSNSRGSRLLPTILSERVEFIVSYIAQHLSIRLPSWARALLFVFVVMIGAILSNSFVLAGPLLLGRVLTRPWRDDLPHDFISMSAGIVALGLCLIVAKKIAIIVQRGKAAKSHQSFLVSHSNSAGYEQVVSADRDNSERSTDCNNIHEETHSQSRTRGDDAVLREVNDSRRVLWRIFCTTSHDVCALLSFICTGCLLLLLLPFCLGSLLEEVIITPLRLHLLASPACLPVHLWSGGLVGLKLLLRTVQSEAFGDADQLLGTRFEGLRAASELFEADASRNASGATSLPHATPPWLDLSLHSCVYTKLIFPLLKFMGVFWCIPSLIGHAAVRLCAMSQACRDEKCFPFSTSDPGCCTWLQLAAFVRRYAVHFAPVCFLLARALPFAKNVIRATHDTLRDHKYLVTSKLLNYNKSKTDPTTVLPQGRCAVSSPCTG